MKFCKMHGAGNDFVVVNGFDEKLEDVDIADLSRRVCDRHLGIGSDGLILVLPSRTASFRMRMLNPDGSEAEMCGNGIRCFGKYVYDYALTRETSITVETLAGVKELKLSAKGGRVQTVRVDMGSPELRRAYVPMKGPGADEQVVSQPIRVGGRKLEVTCLSMGNPHCVVFVDNLDIFPVAKVGPEVEHHPLFPQRTNVPFVQVISHSAVKARVWERGAGETLACGTGACASAIASALNDRTGRKVQVQLAGGTLAIDWTGDNRVLMEGPAEEVFVGEYPL